MFLAPQQFDVTPIRFSRPAARPSNPTRPRTNIDQRAHAGSIVDGNATPGAPAAAMRFALPTRWL